MPCYYASIRTMISNIFTRLKNYLWNVFYTCWEIKLVLLIFNSSATVRDDNTVTVEHYSFFRSSSTYRIDHIDRRGRQRGRVCVFTVGCVVHHELSPAAKKRKFRVTTRERLTKNINSESTTKNTPNAARNLIHADRLTLNVPRSALVCFFFPRPSPV